MDNPDANAIIIRDTPAKVAAAEQLVRQLDRSKAEIMIDINIVEADRDRIRDLGLSLGTVNASTGSITPGIGVEAALIPPAASSTTSGASTAARLGLLAINAIDL